MSILHFLGTGTSTGVPQIGCGCEVCSSSDPRDKRLRTSSLLETDEGVRILIDCGPDFRQQMLQTPPFKKIDAVLITHEHYDHVGGLDDLRPYSIFGHVDIYAEDGCSKHLMERLPYCFAERKYPGVPNIELHRVEPGRSFTVKGVEILPFRIMHGKLPILGFKIGRMAYITDMSFIGPAEIELLKNLDVLVVNALRREPHASHESLAQALQVISKTQARESYLIHISHQMGTHKATESVLPPHVHLAYDGLVVTY